MKQKLTIIKVGGAVVEDEAQLAQLLKDFAAIEGRKVLVHGGGRKATKMAERLGIETQMVNGRRITDAAMLICCNDRYCDNPYPIYGAIIPRSPDIATFMLIYSLNLSIGAIFVTHSDHIISFPPYTIPSKMDATKIIFCDFVLKNRI